MPSKRTATRRKTAAPAAPKFTAAQRSAISAESRRRGYMAAATLRHRMSRQAAAAAHRKRANEATRKANAAARRSALRGPLAPSRFSYPGTNSGQRNYEQNMKAWKKAHGVNRAVGTRRSTRGKATSGAKNSLANLFSGLFNSRR